LLNVSNFHHGARSLEALIDMCPSNHNGEIDRSSLPRRDQLDLHVDALEFWERLKGERTVDTPGAM